MSGRIFSLKSARNPVVTVTPRWLKAHRTSKNLTILDARSRGAYRNSHIVGAVHADLFHYFVPGTDPQGLKSFQEDLARRLGNMGLSGGETMIVYESGFGMRAARVAWMLEYAGAHRVFLLEGGFKAWQKLHFASSKKLERPVARKFKISPASGLLATSEQVRSSRKSVILDVRSEGEFNGTEKRECDTRLGRIPRARWIEWTDFHNGEKFKTSSEMRAILRKNGVSRDKEIVTYCHRGARAASAFYALRSLGYRNVKNYIGSWHEWSAHETLPVVK